MEDTTWFTFYHEAGHILLHSKREVFIDEMPGSTEVSHDPQKEDEANIFAEDSLIRRRSWDAFVDRKDYTSEAGITAFARELGAAGVLTWVKRKVVAIYCDYCERNITAARYFGAGGEYLLARCRAAEMSAACQRSRLHRRVEQRLEREQVRLRAGTAAGQAEWAGLKAQYGNRCLCCGGREADGVALTADHIVPLSRGGEDERSNLQPLCRPCNSAKGRQRWDYRPAAEEPG